MAYENEAVKKITATEINEVQEGGGRDLAILVTEADKYGTDITAMSNFFDICIQQLSVKLRDQNAFDVVKDFPIGDIAVINDVIHRAEVILEGKYEYIPDFDNLPHTVREKLDKNIYKIGESKQVDGNLRAVILDEEGIRVKDITLKRVRKYSDSMETVRNIATQAQMKQISAKLDNIQELQSYQIDRDRDRDIVVPFLNARNFILRAQNVDDFTERKECLIKATDELTAAINAVYTDISTSSKHLVRCTNRPIFQLKKNHYIKNLTLLLQLATKYVGVQMRVYDYLGEKESSKLALEGYQHVLRDFVSKDVNSRGQSTALLIHLNYPYNNENRNFWYQFANDIESALQSDQNAIEGKEVFFVSLEDGYNEEHQ